MLGDATAVLNALVAMSGTLGDPARDYVILGEGNTSARADDTSFWVKASGATLENIGAEGFVRARFEPILQAVNSGEELDPEAVRATLAEATVGDSQRRPSVETFLHALLLQLEDVRFIGHTHPTAVNAILCSQNAESAIAGRLFPDEIVCCGIAPCWVPYTDPGIGLARRAKLEVERFVEAYGERPRSILMQNHGLIALGATPAEVLSATAMWVKTARVLIGTQLFGGPRRLTEEQTQAIHTRPDEAYRKKLIWGR